MTRTVAVLLGAGAGCLVGMQAPINSRLGRSVGTIQAASFSFLIGTVALLALAAILGGGLGGLRNVTHVPAWALVGGLLGAVYVAVALVTVRTLGVTGLSAAVIAGQLGMSLLIDRLGLFGIPARTIGMERIIGLVLLIAGVVLVIRR